MNWKTPYVIYRLNNEGKALVVQSPEDLTKAKYWLQYIAEPFDVLCKTPAHPKHSKKGDVPEYWAHKEITGKSSYTEAEWRKRWESQGWDKNLTLESSEPNA